MGRTLYLLRHATAEPGHINQQDFERALTHKGLEDSNKLGIWLAELNTPTACGGGKGGDADDATAYPQLTSPQQAGGIDFIWCSEAVRTRQTLAQLSLENIPRSYERKLYHATAEAMLGTLRQTEPAAHKVLMVAHNPGVHQLAAALGKSGKEELIHQVHISYAPCTLSIYEFECETWQEAGPENSEIVGVWTAE